MIRILCRGPLDWTLGAEHLLLAFRALVERGVEARLEIVGEGVERERVLYTIDDLGIGGSAHLLREHRYMATTLEEADIVVVGPAGSAGSAGSGTPSTPSTLAEIAAAGAVVVGLVRPASEVSIEHDVTGLTVPFRDSDALAGARGSLALDAGLRRRLVSGAHAAFAKVAAP